MELLHHKYLQRTSRSACAARLQRSERSRPMSKLQVHPLRHAARWQQCSGSLLLCPCSTGSPACTHCYKQTSASVSCCTPTALQSSIRDAQTICCLVSTVSAAHHMEQLDLVLAIPVGRQHSEGSDRHHSFWQPDLKD